MKNVRFVGLDVHAETIAVAVAEPDGEVRSLGIIPNRTESIGRLIRKLGKPEQLRVCYEAGPTGYVLYWQLSELGVKCEVVAPTLVPVKSGDRVKTDRRDAAKLARSYRSGDLTAVWVPDAAHEALRDLVRARLAAKRDQLRARHRLSTEIRDVLLSISFSRFATSTDAAILTRAARAVSGSSAANNDSSAAGWTHFRARSAASCHKSFWRWLRNKESICSSRSLVANASGGCSFCWMNEASNFSISAFWAEVRSCLPSS